MNYTIDVELTKHRGLDVGNTRMVNALLQVISQLTPYEVDIAKLARATSISRPTTLRYLKNLQEAKLIHRLFTNLDSVGGADKGFKQIENEDNSFVAADNIDSAYMRKIPLWAFGFMY